MRSKKLLLLLAGLIVLLIVVSVVAGEFYQPQSTQNNSSLQMQNGVRVPPPQPPLTPADTIAAQQDNTFQFLVSYTDTGFEPRTLVIKAGQTVRFTNNSTEQLWVAASGDTLYPAAQNGCGSSALDSCAALQPGYFWQFTFGQKGTWQFYNNLDKSNIGTIIAQ